METEDKDWGRIYPNVITWIGGKLTAGAPSIYTMLSWVRFWREGKEYQLPVRMDVEGVDTLKQGAKYDEQFHQRCLDIYRYGRATGDFKEPIKFDDKHVITIAYEDIDKINNVEETKEDE